MVAFKEDQPAGWRRISTALRKAGGGKTGLDDIAIVVGVPFGS